MDFQTVAHRLMRYTDYYKRPEIFASDIMLIVENCKQFNAADTQYFKAAIKLHSKFKALYQQEFPSLGGLSSVDKF